MRWKKQCVATAIRQQEPPEQQHHHQALPSVQLKHLTGLPRCFAGPACFFRRGCTPQGQALLFPVITSPLTRQDAAKLAK